MFIKQKIESAKWFIDAIRQRQDTLFRTMYAIMQFQREYFLTGDQKNKAHDIKRSCRYYQSGYFYSVESCK